MKRFVVLCIALMLPLCAAAQNPPEWMFGDHLPTLGPVSIEAVLTDFHVPWSMPTEGQFISFGELNIADNTAEIQINMIARYVCVGDSFCFAINPRPVNIVSSMPWDQRGLFLWMWGDPSSPFFDALTIENAYTAPVGYWRSGTFVYDGWGWQVHPYATYSEYRVIKRVTPLIPYSLLPMTMEVD